MSDFVVSKLNSISIKLIPIIIIIYCSFSIMSSFMGYLLFSELGTSARLKSTNEMRKKTIHLHIGISFIILIVAILHLRSIW